MRKPPNFGFPMGAVFRADSPLTKPAADLLAAFKAEARRMLAKARPPEAVRRVAMEVRREAGRRLTTLA